MRTWIKICLVMFVLISCISIRKYISMPKEVTTPIKNEIEQAIKVKSTDNVIEKSKGFGLGVGVGAPQIVCDSTEQFVSLVPKGGRIFTSLKLEGTLLKKTYLSFIADRAGVIIYEDEYSYSEKGYVYEVTNYDWQEVVLRKKVDELLVMIFVYGLLIFLVFVVVGL